MSMVYFLSRFVNTICPYVRFFCLLFSSSFTPWNRKKLHQSCKFSTAQSLTYEMSIYSRDGHMAQLAVDQTEALLLGCIKPI
jgi:hypothetical protein